MKSEIRSLLVMPRLTQEQRERAIGMLAAGMSPRNISRRFHVHESTVGRLRTRFRETESTRDRHVPNRALVGRSGSPCPCTNSSTDHRSTAAACTQGGVGSHPSTGYPEFSGLHAATTDCTDTGTWWSHTLLTVLLDPGL